MKSKLFLIISVGLLLFMSGCGTEELISQGPFKGGSEGLVLSFIEGAPYTSFSQGEIVSFKTLLSNKGEFDISAGQAKVKLFGFSEDAWPALNTNFVSNTLDLMGIDQTLETGGENIISLGEGSYVKQIYGSYEQPIYARLCYPYETKLFSNVCMSSNKIKQTGVEICDISGEKLISGAVSSGPIQVISLTESYLSSTGIRFAFVIENKEGGKVYSIDRDCESFGLMDEGKIKVEVIPSDVVCHFTTGQSNIGEVSLKEGSKTLICDKSIISTDSYSDVIELKISYKYETEISTIMNVIGE
ncbi:hypothetical protein HOD61_01895 [archaeon]|jgi:hypothetical protein|nr:hypothetical protein [archaeon]